MSYKNLPSPDMIPDHFPAFQSFRPEPAHSSKAYLAPLLPGERVMPWQDWEDEYRFY